MQTVYHLEANELDNRFIESLKALFAGQTLEIIVSAVDETEYLLRSNANKERLLRAVEWVESGRELIEVDLDSL